MKILSLLKGALVVLLLIFVASCEFSDNDEAIVPAYIYVPSFSIQTDTADGPNYEGRPTHKITDMWITANGDNVGAYGLPVLVPVQKSGSTSIGIDAGIFKTGQDDQRMAYPFIETYYETRQLKPNVIDTVIPVFKYRPNVKFPLIVDYDKASTSLGFDLSTTSRLNGDSIVAAIDNGSREPNNPYMKLQVKQTSTSFQIVTSGEFALSNLGEPVYMEIDFKSNMLLKFGYYCSITAGQQNNVVDLFPSSDWKKIYINLTEEMSAVGLGPTFKFYIGFFNTDGSVPDVSLDNIKLVKFE